MLENFKEVDLDGPGLAQLLQNQGGLSQLTIGSDGGAIPHGPFKGFGSLGWCICTKHNILWRGQGPVRGYPDNPSFRTEAYAMLTFLRLILHQYRFWDIPIPDATVHCHTDSLSLIKKMKSMRAMFNDWYNPIFTWHHIDVLQQIDLSLKELRPLKFKPLHVKAHADKKKPFRELTRPEQVNVYCDRAATTELREQMTATNQRPQFEPLPNINTYLQHQGNFVTSHEQSLLLWTRAEQDIKEYYAKKYDWSRTTKTMINWHAFGKARQGLPHLDHFIPKLCAGWLPTYYQLNKTEGLPDKCPLCEQSETTDHLFVCKLRHASRTKFFMRFQGLLIDLKTSPKIQKAMVDGIKGLIARQVDPNNQPIQPTSNAARHQDKIGWHHVFRGFIAQQWQAEQQAYTVLQYPQQDDDSPRAQWATTVTKFLLKTSHETWSERCQVVHHKTSRQDSEHEKLRAETRLKAIYRYSNAVNALDRENIFGIDIDIDIRLRQSSQDILIWCSTIKPALKRAIKDFQEEMRKGQTKTYEFGESNDADTKKSKIPKKSKRARRRHSSGQAQSSTQTDNNMPT